MLEPADADALRVPAGAHLTSIAAGCGIEGGPDVLAAWNGLADPNHVEAGQALLVPKGTACALPTLPATVPRYTAPWTACSMPWQAFQPCNDPPWPPMTRAEAGEELEIDAFEAFLKAERRCATPVAGMQIRWRPEKAPGLEVVREGRSTYVETEYYGVGGSSGDAPQFAVVDLDADGDAEIVVTQLLGWSNGISLPSYRVRVFEEPTSAPVNVETLMLHPGGWAKAPTGACDLLAVAMVRLDDPVRGEGNYFVGPKLRWDGTGFSFAPEPVVPARRLDDAFFDEVHVDADPPASWLMDGTAEARPLTELGPVTAWLAEPASR
jgi:hypothetical protein